MTTGRGDTLLVALDDTPAVHGVLTVALGIAQMVGTEVEALHISDGERTARIAAEATNAAGVHLHRTQGPVAEKILEALQAPQMVGAVMGTRAFRGGPRPAGSIALQVIAGMSKPVAFVPPDLHHLSAEAPRRLLVPLDSSVAASTAFLELEHGLRPDVNREITVLLALDGMMPSMLDDPTRDMPEWGLTFLSRHCPGEQRSFEWRTGDPGSAVIDVAEQTHSDLIVLSFGGNLEIGHGAVVQQVLTRSLIPVLVLPAPQAALSDDMINEASLSRS